MVGYLKAKRVVVGAFVAAGAAVALGRRGVADPTGDYTEHGFVRRRISTPAGEMAYYEAGRGRPLVFLHGIGGGASAWTWSKVAPAFTANYRVIVPDWVGWGESEHPRRLLMFEDYVAQLETLLGHLGRPATVVTQSLATGFASELARKKPEAFDGMVMLTPSGGLDFGEDAFGPVARRTLTPLARTWPVNMLLYRLVFHQQGFIRGWFKSQGFYEPRAVSREIVDAFLYSARKPGAAYAALPFLTGDLRFDLAPYMRDLRVPAAMIWGSDERQVGRWTGERLAALNPDVPLMVIDRTRATPELELPAQTITAIEASIEGLHSGRDGSRTSAKRAVL